MLRSHPGRGRPPAGRPSSAGRPMVFVIDHGPPRPTPLPFPEPVSADPVGWVRLLNWCLENPPGAYEKYLKDKAQYEAFGREPRKVLMELSLAHEAIDHDPSRYALEPPESLLHEQAADETEGRHERR